MDVVVLFGAIAALFTTLIAVFYKWIASLQEENRTYRDKIVPLMERMMNTIERMWEDQKDHKRGP